MTPNRHDKICTESAAICFDALRVEGFYCRLCIDTELPIGQPTEGSINLASLEKSIKVDLANAGEKNSLDSVQIGLRKLVVVDAL
jgi:hypothetical protein